jgi:hypothetical protein
MPPFHPGNSRAVQKKQEERKRVQEEWGWENEATVQLWEARAKARKGKKKQVALTADEKLKRF